MSRLPHGLTRLDQLMKVHARADLPAPPPLPSVFGRLLPPNPLHLEHLTHAHLIETLDALASSMGRDSDTPGIAPAGMTFFGQFVDHDVTLDATSALGSRIVPSTISNVRTPALDLDCVYGAGPEASPHLYGNDDAAFFLVMGTEDNAFDLARTSNGTALIGDPRNDENGIVSQIQANFVALHNILMTELLNNADTHREIHECARMGMSSNDWTDHVPDSHTAFEEVRRFIRLHYQYVVWTELLPAFVKQSCLDNATTQDVFGKDAPIMPVEFSGAAYRFGHATTQPDYKLHEGDAAETSMLDILGFGARSSVIDMNQFFDIDGNEAQKARPVAPSLGAPLLRLPFIQDTVHLADVNVDMTLAQSQNLALRNMVRDRYTYQLASGQQVADWFKSKHHWDLPRVDVPEILADKGIVKTPLWFYSLQEAETHGHGRLTGVGGNIVASVFARLLRLDPTTYWHASGFKPSVKFANAGGVLAGMMKYAETHRGSIDHADALKNG